MRFRTLVRDLDAGMIILAELQSRRTGARVRTLVIPAFVTATVHRPVLAFVYVLTRVPVRKVPGRTLTSITRV